MLMLSNFSVRRPKHELPQQRALDWLSELHATAEATRGGLSEQERTAFAARYRKLLERCACGPADLSFTFTRSTGFGFSGVAK